MEDKVERKTESAAKRKIEFLNNEGSLRDLCDNMKHDNISIIVVPKGEEREEGIENLSEEIMTEKSPNLAKEKDIPVQEAQGVLTG